MNAPVRVFQVATGNVGTEMIKRLGNRTDLELVGLHCYSSDKIGRDAGEIVGLPAIGVKATGTVEDIIAAKPDVLVVEEATGNGALAAQLLRAGYPYAAGCEGPPECALAIYSRWPIAALVRPSAIRPSTSRSRGLSAPMALSPELRNSKRSMTSGSIAVPPAATRRTASTNCLLSNTRSLSR